MATYSQMQTNSVLSAKWRIACIAAKNLAKEASGQPTDYGCIKKVKFTYGLMRDVECYVIDGDDNCWTEAQFLTAMQMLDGLLN